MSSRRRFHHGGGGASDNEDGGGPAAAAPAVVDQAECTARSCRSCVAVSLADCIALGCCPCAVVSLLGLALVKAPLAVGRRCLRRLRRRQGKLRHKKRVRDDLDLAPGAKLQPGSDAAAASKSEDDFLVTTAMAAASPGLGHQVMSDAEKVWQEMYQVGHWGFGRLSFSVNPPSASARAGYVATGRDAADDDSCESDV
ncbi:uncharacterized protein LOC100846397 isoform X2 [Brachypodium distachyon]|uniref:Uncharacterized protein n=2 Tax=Brachypodium distachyon TaxID=15368 RepID=A0A0Q3GCJ3_BRADI|nr:uncharacterized protein LOC100846397 isoform X2 [Brachypodium distachyon]KQK09048.1 hypothetical protein BRADI_2g45720v3 [Brachypodium distachyon]|eukprot:XP_014753935.1 uncharacterized protein LOC100846397 isoform X2 [Brachypodium distachyon]